MLSGIIKIHLSFLMFLKFTLSIMKNIITDSKKIDEILERGTIVEFLPSKEEFREKLLSGKKLKLYIGFDATAPTLHLSHAKNFILMEKFRKLGHETIILFGDFTARIGDPSGKSSARKQLSRKDVITNVKKWKKMVEPLMDFQDTKNPPKIMYNNDWLAKLSFEDVINLASNLTVQQMLERDMFQKRLKANKPIHLHEFLYPLMQGFDSVAMDVDVEVCGTDQIFNALVGRKLSKKLKNKDKSVVAVTLMENPKTGELMSKSKGTGVFLDVSPQDMYGQIMAQPDEMIEILFINCTLLPLETIAEYMKLENPRDAKMKLALEITKIFHGKTIASKAQEHFVYTIQKKQMPTKLKEIIVKTSKPNIIDLLIESKLVSSKTEARRLVAQNGIKIDGKKITELDNIEIPKSGVILQKGKRHFVKITTK